MDKGGGSSSSITTVNQKKSAPKQSPKTKKKQPLKVVYITNPIKFKATASEFRALVQELTGQDADMSESSTWFSAATAGEVMEAKPPGQQGNVHAQLQMEGRIMEDPNSGFGSPYEDVFYTSAPEMMDGFGSAPGCDDRHVYKSLDAV